jgi:DNA processing protein
VAPAGAELALNAATAWIGPHRFHTLLKRFGRAEAVLAAGAGSLSAAVPALSLRQAQALLDYCRAFDAEAEARALSRPGLGVLRWDGPGYPGRLRELPDPPPLLFVERALPPEDLPRVAVVGTRTPTDYGRRMAREIAGGLARCGVCVVSGLAKGIDAEAHAACLEAGGATLAVLGTGLDRVWPPENRELARRIAHGGGALISQFSMGAPGLKMHFPMRNGVISGLSLGVVVVEGARRSGALITADRALEQGREVFAVPGPADAPMSQGPLDLLEQGARLVRGWRDVVDELGIKAAPPPEGAAAAAAGGRPGTPPALRGLPEGSPPRRLWDSLPDRGGMALERAGESCGLDPAALAAAVTELELLGLIRQLPGARLERTQARP